MTNEEFNNVYLTATIKAVRTLIDINLEPKGITGTSDKLTDQEAYNLLITASQTNSPEELAREARKINGNAFPSYDFIHKPGSSYVQCFKQLYSFGKKYQSCFVKVEKEPANDKAVEQANPSNAQG
jgi:hypothetical protein